MSCIVPGKFVTGICLVGLVAGVVASAADPPVATQPTSPPATQPSSSSGDLEIGQSVRWTLTVVSVRPAADEGFIVLARRESGQPVAVRLRADEKDRAMACRIGKPITFAGRIVEVHPMIDRTAWDSLFRDAPASPKGLAGIVLDGSPPTKPGAAPLKTAPVQTAGAGPAVVFFGAKAQAKNVIYLTDRSGSMIDTFDQVKLEMLRSIGRLRPTQRFRVLLMADGPPKGFPRVKASTTTTARRDNKISAGKFIDSALAEGMTDPLPALKDAFATAKAADGPTVIFLLTDGVFNDNDRVLAEVAQAKLPQSVVIHTILFGNQPPEAVEVMKKIAKQTGGEYRFVEGE